MEILRAVIEDATEILNLQKIAYRSEAELYGPDIPPLIQTVSGLKEQFGNHVVLKSVIDDKIVGSVRAYEKDGTCYIGRLAVHPNEQNKGIGKALMNEIESCHQGMRYELFAGTRSDKNIQLYQKLGYKIFRTRQYECAHVEIHYMEKNNY